MDFVLDIERNTGVWKHSRQQKGGRDEDSDNEKAGINARSLSPDWPSIVFDLASTVFVSSNSNRYTPNVINAGILKPQMDEEIEKQNNM